MSDHAPPPTGTLSGRYGVDYAELERLASEHDQNARDIVSWALGDQDFAERYLHTHGTINFGTYLKVKEFLANRAAAGAAFADRSARTSAALRATVAVTAATDDANAASVAAPGTAAQW